MTIGILQIQGLLIQAVGQVYQAALATPKVFLISVEATASGGLPQCLGPNHGGDYLTTASPMSAEMTTIGTTAFQHAALKTNFSL